MLALALLVAAACGCQIESGLNEGKISTTATLNKAADGSLDTSERECAIVAHIKRPEYG